MASKNVDLASLRIDRSPRGLGSSRKLRWIRRIIYCLVLSAIFIGALWFFRGHFYPGVEVQLVTASLTSPAQASSVLTASGYVAARRKAAVASKGTGRLVYLGVEEGDKVKKGQIIARLEDTDVQAALARAKGNFRIAEADLKEAKRSLERTEILLTKGFIPPSDYDSAEAKYKRVIASIDEARFAVKQAEVEVENTRIVAPFDGTVLKKNADVGEIVAPLAGAAGSRGAVVTIADMSSLEVEADVSEANITRVLSGQNCEIRLDAYPDHGYHGWVSKIVPTVDRAKATVLVKIEFKKYDRRVLPEMSAKITFLAKGYGDDTTGMKPRLTIPSSAVGNKNGQDFVFQIQEQRAVEVSVVTGQRFGSLVEIKEGLREGDKVVGKIAPQLRAGSKVSLKE